MARGTFKLSGGRIMTLSVEYENAEEREGELVFRVRASAGLGHAREYGRLIVTRDGRVASDPSGWTTRLETLLPTAEDHAAALARVGELASEAIDLRPLGSLARGNGSAN